MSANTVFCPKHSSRSSSLLLRQSALHGPAALTASRRDKWAQFSVKSSSFVVAWQSSALLLRSHCYPLHGQGCSTSTHPPSSLEPHSLPPSKILLHTFVTPRSTFSLNALHSTVCSLLTRPSTSPFHRSLASSVQVRCVGPRDGNPRVIALYSSDPRTGGGLLREVRIKDCCERIADCSNRLRRCRERET